MNARDLPSLLLAIIAVAGCSGAPGGPNVPIDAGDAGAPDSGQEASGREASGREASGREASGPESGGAEASTYTLANLGTACGSITPNQLIARLQPSYMATYTAGAVAGYPSKNPKAPSALTIGAKYAGGALTCTPAVCGCDPPCGPCTDPPTIGVDLEFAFATADGVFNEHFTGTATMYPGETRVQWQGILSPSEMKGTFVPTFSPKEQVIFGGDFDGTSTTGIVDELVPNEISGPGGQW